jgi:hypothetical protein
MYIYKFVYMYIIHIYYIHNSSALGFFFSLDFCPLSVKIFLNIKDNENYVINITVNFF